MGYVNTGLSNTLIYVQEGDVVDPLKNIITPLEYNGRQQDLYRTGEHPFDFEIIDSNHVLQSGTVITWSLGTVVLRIRLTDLSRANLCHIKYPNNCPLWIKNFCNDNSYCNGHEACAPKFIRQVNTERFGTCQASVRAVTCGSDMVCDENHLGCIQPVTASPTGEPTTRAPTEAPTDAVTTTTTTVVVQPNSGECIIDSDCSEKKTFCLGSSICLNNQCKFDSTYNPCGSGTNNGTLVPGRGLMTTICSEEGKMCIIYYTCNLDSDCDDGLLCSGEEKCGDNICHPGSPVRCLDQSLVCNEVTGCGELGVIRDEDILIDVATPTTAAPTSTTTHTNTGWIIFWLVFGAICILLLILIIFFIIGSLCDSLNSITL